MNPEASLASSEASAPRRAESTRWFAGVLAHGAGTMFFVALAFAAGWYRMRGLWVLPAVAPSVLPPCVAGAFLLGVGPLLLRASRVDASTPRRALPWLGGALVSGAGFLGTQAAWLHVMFWYRDLRVPEGGAFASAFYGLSALQAVHVGLVLLAVLVAAVSTWRGGDARDAARRALAGWLFTVATFGLLFLAVYLP
ncbi:hypothetical protein DRW03_17035 [Corallococcus sp. H22C18031201]|uniref:hypothetical protein n=1 Tax=Citreicoccus inhibens TaxID=2849499 RepID=UPI000E74FD47|nr:hypothetical protein [Citreicoccus inhibens]MBU8897319.1 hypothetical protein [Citreicoccus inhibens]RJS21121.1 hypothetical protein DRW03_17035 [Corallococcus sp. H22C18031201]